MSDPAAIAREYFDAWNRRDWDRFRVLYHREYSYAGVGGQRQGPEGHLAIAQMFASAFPDSKIEIQRVYATGEVAITEFVGRGTHLGDVMGIPPTGRSVSMPVCNVIEVREGKIYAEREYMDMAHVMRQLGVMPAPATA